MNARPVLLGMNNPLSRRAEHALYPDPVNCTGWRIWKMLHARTGASQDDYLEAFDRRNLLNAKTWSLADARWAAGEARRDLRDRTVIILGAEPVKALDLPPVLLHPQVIDGVTWRQMPHPSGQNPWYHKPDNRLVAELLLEELYETWRGADA